MGKSRVPNPRTSEPPNPRTSEPPNRIRSQGGTVRPAGFVREIWEDDLRVPRVVLQPVRKNVDGTS